MNSSPKRFLPLSSRANIIALLIVLLSAGLVPIFLNTYFYVDREVTSTIRTILYIILGIMLGGSVLQYLLIYLEPTRSSDIKSYDVPPDIYKSISEQITRLQDQIKNVGTVKFDVDNISETRVVDSLMKSLSSTITQKFTEGVFKSIDEEFAKRDLQNKRSESFVIGLEEIRKRLIEETHNLAIRANLNLSLGTITTTLALIGLVIILFVGPLTFTEHTGLELNNFLPGIKYDGSELNKIVSEIKEIQSNRPYGWTILNHYLPRLSLIVFAELFAYFFLRLYKSGLEDIKYYQNELTNVELKLSALKTALATEDNEIIKLVIGELVRVDRNFVLKKDETTVDLEKMKSENINTRDLLTQISALLESKK